MTTAYTSLLGLALPVTGELSGTWGDTVNDYITQYLDASVAGTQTISGSQTAVTLSKTTNAALTQAGTGATGSSQYSVINCTGNPASMLTVTVPAASKTYVVVNATSTNQDVKIVGAGPTTGVTLVAGEKAIIAWNGSDFIKVASSTVDGVSTISFGSTGLTPSTATTGAITVAGTLATTNGGTGLTTFGAANRAIYSTSSSALTAGTLPTAAGGTGLTSFTANGVVYASSSSALTTGSALTFDGSRLTVSGAAPSFRLDDSDTSGAFGIDWYYSATGVTRANISLNISGEMQFQAGASGSSGWFQTFVLSGAEQMRLTSTGLGIGTSSPGQKLHVVGSVSTGLFEGSTLGGITLQKTGTNGVQLFSDAAGVLKVYNNQTGVTAATIDTSGNLGLGVTPSASWSGQSAFQVNTRSAFAGSSNFTAVATNAIATSNGWAANYLATGTAALYTQSVSTGAHAWYTAPSGTAGDPISFTQAMTLTAAGDLGVGTTTPSNSTGYKTLSLNGTTGGQIAFQTNTVANQFIYNTATDLNFFNGANGNHIFFTNGFERARITSGGNLLVGTTTDPGGSGIIADANGNVRAIPRSGSAKTTSYTLVKGDVGEFIEVGSGGSVTIPDSVFATGDVVSVFNNTSGTITITCSITTAYIAGTDSDKATMTLATRGVATILFISGTVCVVSGNVT